MYQQTMNKTKHGVDGAGCIADATSPAAAAATLIESYESAVHALVSPSAGIHQATSKEAILKSSRRRTKTVSDMRYYWNKIIKYHAAKATAATTNTKEQSQRPRMPRPKPLLIHITGTKGKGSTACMCEAILRSHGYTTGLFTSPHLMDIRERIRWNGRPIHPRIFAHVYWTIRRALETTENTNKDDDTTTQDTTNANTTEEDEEEEDDPPPTYPGYFRMLTLMGLYTFLYELSPPTKNDHNNDTNNNINSSVGVGVDVIILEVGMGGRYDATNFLDTATTTTRTGTRTTSCSYNDKYFQRVVHGVTVLDLDHTRILGTTLEHIAWEKGGIFAVNKLNPEGITRRPITTTATTTIKSNKVDEDTIVSSSSSMALSSSSFSSATKFILNSNTPEVIAIMKSCSRIEGKDDDGKLVSVDSKGTQLKDALLRRQQHSSSSSLSVLGLAGNHQYGNATLAVALCRAVTAVSTPDAAITTVTLTTTSNTSTDDDIAIESNDEKTTSVLSSSSSLSSSLIKKRRIERINIDSSVTLDALCNAAWPGRCQTFIWSSSSSFDLNMNKTDTTDDDVCSKEDDDTNHNTIYNVDDNHDDASIVQRNIKFYLDGAHTLQSLDATVDWFHSRDHQTSSSDTNNSRNDNNNNNSGNCNDFVTDTSRLKSSPSPLPPSSSLPSLPILVFNCSHERNPVELLELLLQRHDGHNNDVDPTTRMLMMNRHYSRVYFAKSDSFRPSPVLPASAESLLEECGIPIRNELLILSDNERNKNDVITTQNTSRGEEEREETPAVAPTATERTWQETLAIVWKHLLVKTTTPPSTKCNSSLCNSDTKTMIDDDDNAMYCGDNNSILRCNMTANEIVQEISFLQKQNEQEQQQQPQHTKRGCNSIANDNDNDNDICHGNQVIEVFVTGSLYLVGSFLTALNWEEKSSPLPTSYTL